MYQELLYLLLELKEVLTHVVIINSYENVKFNMGISPQTVGQIILETYSIFFSI